MLKTKVDVDIVSANFNNAEYIEDFIESILASTWLPRSLIIVDDKSLDDSVEIIKRYFESELKIILIELSENRGFANALNEGLKHSSAKYILRLDPDDKVHKERIERQYGFLEDHSEVDIVGTDVVYFSTMNSFVGASDFPVSHEEISKRYRSGGHGVCHGAVMIRRRCFINFEYVQCNVPCEEYDIFSRQIIAGHRFENIKEKLTFVRVHPDSVSNRMPYSTVRLTYELRFKLWGIRTPILMIMYSYMLRRLYRQHLAARGVSRLIIIFVLTCMAPHRALSRLIALCKKK